MATSPQIAVGTRAVGVESPASPTSRIRRPSAEASWLWLAVITFVAVSAWWFGTDDRIPIWDSGVHLMNSYNFALFMKRGDTWVWFQAWTTYPPLVYLVGAATYLIGGLHPMAMSLVSNAIFVPLLAFGCYGVGLELLDRRAGLLAGLFALGTPMLVSMMHSFMIDPPQAAMVAVTLWALLASRRFARIGISVVAGVLFGLALMTKETSLVFLAGPTAVIVLRGGWRRLGLGAFLLCALGIALPWYIYHWSQLTGTFNGVTTTPFSVQAAPPHFSLTSFGWYFWDLMNEQAMLPFTLLFACGVFAGAARLWRVRVPRETEGIGRLWRRRFPPDEFLPEVLGGALVSYLGMTWLTDKDPRYTLPGLVYVAVLATFWIPSVRRRGLRLGLASAAVLVAAFNFAGMSFGIGGASARVLVTLPGEHAQPENSLYPGQLTIYEDQGWLRGPPQHVGDLESMLRGLHQQGIAAVAIDPADDGVNFSQDGLLPLIAQSGTTLLGAPTQQPHTAYLFQHRPTVGQPAPCRWIEGTGVYAVEGYEAGLDAATLDDPHHPRVRYEFVCPNRVPRPWP